MAREIVILDIAKSSTITVTCVFWLVANANSTRPLPGASSAVPSSPVVAWGATAAELLAIQSGAVVERMRQYEMPIGSTPAQVQSLLQKSYGDEQTSLSSQAPGAKFIGASWDGTTWTAAP